MSPCKFRGGESTLIFTVSPNITYVGQLFYTKRDAMCMQTRSALGAGT